MREKIPNDNLHALQPYVKNIDLVGDPVSLLGAQTGFIYQLAIPATLIGKYGFVEERSTSGVALSPPRATSPNWLDYHLIDTVVDVLKLTIR